VTRVVHCVVLVVYIFLLDKHDRHNVILDDRNLQNSSKKFSAAKLLARKDRFYRNMLTIVKSYHRVSFHS